MNTNANTVKRMNGKSRDNPTQRTHRLIGLTGYAGAGKDTVADILVEEHGFTKFSFSDALYEEVALAFGVGQAVLQDRETKEKPLPALALNHCSNEQFIKLMLVNTPAWTFDGMREELKKPYSPRQILQAWGTEYRRAQDPDYWIKRAKAFADFHNDRPLVNTSVRFPNESAWLAAEGEVWCVRRPGCKPINGHISEAEQPHSRVIPNDSTINGLRAYLKEILK